MRATRILSQAEVGQRVKEMYDGTYVLSSTYINNVSPIDLTHTKCGTTYTVGRAKGFMKEGKNRCPVCRPVNLGGNSVERIGKLELIERIEAQVGTEYKYLGGLTAMKNPVNMRHNTCGNEFEVSPKMFLGVKQTRCPKCANLNRGKYLRDINYLQNALDAVPHGNEYKWLDEYDYDNKKKLRILHITCNREYEVRPNDFQQGYQCPHCAAEKTESYVVTKIAELLSFNEIKFNREVSFKNLKHKDYLKFDFQIKHVNFLIEFDGIQHFKTTTSSAWATNFEVSKLRDSIKNEWAKSHAVNFIRIPHDIENSIEIEDLFNAILNEDYEELTNLCKKARMYLSLSDSEKVLNELNYYTSRNASYFK